MARTLIIPTSSKCRVQPYRVPKGATFATGEAEIFAGLSFYIDKKKAAIAALFLFEYVRQPDMGGVPCSERA